MERSAPFDSEEEVLQEANGAGHWMQRWIFDDCDGEGATSPSDVWN